VIVELSADLGEGSPGEDEIWPLIQRANVACGGHIGDAASMREAADNARKYNVILGAHPSYPDRENFGRESMAMDPAALRDAIIAQIAALEAIAPVHHVKPHGALYNDAHRDVVLARVIVDAIEGRALVAPAHSQMANAAREAGTPFIAEAFADRRYEPDGSLTPRSIAGSTLTIEEAAAQAALLAREHVVIARDGSRISVHFDTLCIHADMPGAAERLRAIVRAI
jgi:UPF0271 protein